MELSALKRDGALLLAVLKRDRPGQHVRCSFHHDAHGSMAITQLPDGTWWWKCYSGCGSGTIIDAAMRAYRCATPAEALRTIERELGIKIGRDENYQEPRIDQDRAERLVSDAHRFLMENEDIQERLLAGKRGIVDLELVKRFRLGFVIGARFREWRSWNLTGWILPITDADEQLVAVKIHQEGRRDPKSPKCLWAPFGLYPPAKPLHRVFTLWPPPELYDHPDRLYLCPGELKAVAMLGAGLPATSLTAGESTKLSPKLLDRLRKVAPQHILVAWDNDPPKRRPNDGTTFYPGREWRDRMVEQLRAAGLATEAVLIQRPRQEPAPEPPETPQGPEGLPTQDDPTEAPGGAVALESNPSERAAVVQEAIPESPEGCVSANTPLNTPPKITHRFPGEFHPRDPKTPCETCGGVDFWDAFPPGGLVCRACLPPPPARNSA